MNKNNKTLKVAFVEAFQNYKDKNFKNAELICFKILSIDPYHMDSITLLATISALNRNFDRAKELMIKAIAIQPKNTSALNNLGIAYKELGKIEEAINTYKKVLEINPNHVNANYNLGLAYYGLKELKKAKSCFQKTVKIQNNYAFAFFSLANVHVDLKEFKEALSCYQKAIEINPNIVMAHNNLGLLYREMNNFPNAINCYKKALNIKSDHANSHHNLALTYKEVGDFDKSIESHKKAIKSEPGNLMHDHFLSELKKDILDSNLKNKIEKILSTGKPKVTNLAYGNYLLSKYERKIKNYENELNYLIEGHKNFFNSHKSKFDLNNKFCFDDVHQIMEGGKVKKTNIKSDIEIKPIFIIGVPRTGTTLVERIVASGKKFIPIGEETGIIGHYIPKKVLEKQSLNLGNVDEIRNELLDIYKERGLILKKYDYQFTDKSLDNFFYLNLINQIYPNVKIINCRRDVLSSIMSIFQNNLTALAWTHNLDNIFRYFDNYFKIIEKYNEINLNKIYELKFEELVSNPDKESKKLMKFCELPWDKKCLEFHKRKDLFSKTASNIQIREAIYKHSLDKYLPYKKLLDEYGKKYSWFN